MNRRIVLAGLHGIGQGPEETGPAGAAVELGIGGIKIQRAAGAGENTLAMLIVQRRGEGRFGALVAQHVIGGGRKQLFPFRIALGHFIAKGRAAAGKTALPISRLPRKWRRCISVSFVASYTQFQFAGFAQKLQGTGPFRTRYLSSPNQNPIRS